SAGALPATNTALHEEIQHAVEAEAALRDGENTSDRTDHLGSDIFISYAREDREAASALARMLTARGWRVWWDRKIKPGEAFDVIIERELCTCKCAVVLWSANSVNATWVRNEARRAKRRKVLIPILIDQVETPLEFENLQAADLTSWTPPADHPELETIVDRIQALSPLPDVTYQAIANQPSPEHAVEADSIDVGDSGIDMGSIDAVRSAAAGAVTARRTNTRFVWPVFQATLATGLLVMATAGARLVGLWPAPAS